MPGHPGHPRVLRRRSEAQLGHERDEAIVDAGAEVDHEGPAAFAHHADAGRHGRRGRPVAVDDDLVEEDEGEARGDDRDPVGPLHARSGDVRAEGRHRGQHVGVLEVGELGRFHGAHPSIRLGVRGSWPWARPERSPATRPHHWHVDDLDDLIDAAIDRAIAGLPAGFAGRLESVAIVVEDEPTPDQLESVGASGLYGLYQGVPRTRLSADAIAVPSKITIFKGPLARSARTPEAFGLAVEATVRHEIAHHFGISDDRLRELERHPGG
ncbi:MAG: metallopeptidase family protein [Chloroflexi bacterium]|nr:metallopeptidase family protein [Chloroflexota bacterium]